MTELRLILDLSAILNEGAELVPELVPHFVDIVGTEALAVYLASYLGLMQIRAWYTLFWHALICHRNAGPPH